jgi:imidazolonepropionase-like amidohydrolase
MHANPLSALLWLSLTASFPAFADPVVIEGVTVVSPEREAPLRDAFVLLAEGRIRSVSAERPPVDKGVRMVDGRGRFLVPGLIDSHVHIGMPPGMGILDEDFEKRHADILTAYWRQAPRSYLYHGVTALVDLAAWPGSTDRFRSAPQAPDLVTCAPLVLAEGYPAMFFPAELRSRYLRYMLSDDPAAAVRLVQRARQDGHRCIKLFFAGDLPSDPVVQSILAEARKIGLPVAIHANSLGMQAAALRYKPDVLAHGLWNWDAHDLAPGLPEPIRQHLDAVLASGAAYQPTFGVMDGLANLFDPGFLDDPALKKIVPPALLAWYRTDEAQFFKNGLKAERPAFADPAVAREAFRGGAGQGERAVSYLAQHGARILLASDTPSAPTWTDQPGLNTWRELQHLAQAGLPPRDLLKAGTIRNAEEFGLQDRGTVEPGKVANLLLLRADPLATVEAWDAIETVILHGELIPRESLAVPSGSATPR